jgi:hypothetical protein
MRIKNADKIKQPSDMTREEIRFQLCYGNKCDRDALNAIRALDNALNMKTEAQWPTPAFDKQIFDMYREEFWKYVATNFQESKSKHDGTFFRKLAGAMEVYQKPPDPAWSCGLGEIQDRVNRGLPMPTVSEMHRILLECEIVTTRKTVERIFKFAGHKPAPAKRGPRPGTMQKSVHRVSR